MQNNHPNFPPHLTGNSMLPTFPASPGVNTRPKTKSGGFSACSRPWRVKMVSGTVSKSTCPGLVNGEELDPQPTHHNKYMYIYIYI